MRGSNNRERHVLVVSTMLDVSTDAVVRALGDCGVTCTRINTEMFPFDSGLALRIGMEPSPNSFDFAFRRPESTVLTDTTPTSIWFRRVRAPARGIEMSPGVYDFCIREARSTLVGGLLAHHVPVMSPPANVWAAEHKVFQLRAAQEAGLTIPKTVVTNDPHTVAETFRAFAGRMIAKPARAGYVDYGDEQHAIYTTRILEEHLENIGSVRWSPAIYQPLVEKACDVRVTYVGGELFVADIDSQTDPDASIDWRRTSNPNLPHRQGALPERLSSNIERFMSSLGLAFGAIDFIRTKSGEYVFLEVNPNGQWLWLEERLGFPIAARIARWLSGDEL